MDIFASGMLNNFHSASLAIDVREGNDRKRKLGWLPQANFSGYKDDLNPLRYEDEQPEKNNRSR